MHEIAWAIMIAIIAVAASTFVYKIMPYKSWTNKKPRFTLFPKYVAKFFGPTTAIESVLENIEFKKSSNGVYTRGKVYGDFSAKSIKLTVEVDGNKKEVKVYASFFGILFDTGDVWQVTSDIIKGLNNESASA